jgi:hypothetical protein
MTKNPNPFVSHEVFAEHMRRHEAFEEWLDERLGELGYRWSTSFELLGDDGVSVDTERYGEINEIHFKWDELTDETGETHRRAVEERKLRSEKARKNAERRAREDAVKNLERALEKARAKLEENK